MIYDAKIKLFPQKWPRRKRPKRKFSHICLPRGICDFFAIPKLINGYQKVKQQQQQQKRGT